MGLLPCCSTAERLSRRSMLFCKRQPRPNLSRGSCNINSIRYPGSCCPANNMPKHCQGDQLNTACHRLMHWASCLSKRPDTCHWQACTAHPREVARTNSPLGRISSGGCRPEKCMHNIQGQRAACRAPQQHTKQLHTGDQSKLSSCALATGGRRIAAGTAAAGCCVWARKGGNQSPLRRPRTPGSA